MNVKHLGASVISAMPIGVGSATKQLAVEAVYLTRHLKGKIKARQYRGRHGIAMHLGCGDRIKDGWVNIDLRRTADLTLDVRERLPFADNTFSIIYSEHVLECFDYPNDITKLLSECYRVLEPGGVHSFSVPDGEEVLRYYVTQEDDDMGDAHKELHPTWCKTQMDHVNYCMRDAGSGRLGEQADGRHRWYYDEETMRMLLETVGFVEVQRREFNPELDQEVRRIGSLYMKCTKPI